MIAPKIMLILKKLDSVQIITYLDRPDRVALLAEHSGSIPMVVGSIPAVVRHILGSFRFHCSYENDRKILPLKSSYYEFDIVPFFNTICTENSRWLTAKTNMGL